MQFYHLPCLFLISMISVYIIFAYIYINLHPLQIKLHLLYFYLLRTTTLPLPLLTNHIYFGWEWIGKTCVYANARWILWSIPVLMPVIVMLRPTTKMFVCPPHQVEKSAGGWIIIIIISFFCKVAFWGHFSANNTELYVRNTEWNEKRLNKLN